MDTQNTQYQIRSGLAGGQLWWETTKTGRFLPHLLTDLLATLRQQVRFRVWGLGLGVEC